MKKQYGLEQMTSINNMFHKMIHTSKHNMTTSLRTMKKYAEEERPNPWFRKSATILALNTKINIQKSFWRLKYNMDSSGVQYNTTAIVKLKKLYNNIRKHYELNLIRAFLMIGQAARTNSRTDKPKARSPEPPARQPAPAPAPAPVQVQSSNESSAKVDAVVQNSKKASVSIIDRVFKRHMTKHVRKWQYNAHPEKKLEFIHSEMTKKSKDEYEYVSKYGAVETISKISTSSQYKAKAKSFRCILEFMLKKKIDQHYDSGLEERLELINRQNALMEEIRTYKDENENLSHDLEDKDKILKESKETISLLSLRINYMITQKFLIMMEKVW